ncbi:hypothetical protein [Polyangium sp. 6x1]|uniref:hypothetical protein n=1 Tax=Polyangium sp. 6x1 TaxID=3042689 RepID=UPI0024821844|nr:hypothetical protein [Polyangium sp. 6x1]MDI1444435.1 hypothetical protein [Polyangium sp. 6x1]
MAEVQPSKLDAALDQVLAGGPLRGLIDVLDRHSNLPGTRPNLDFARTVGIAIASRRGKADALVRALLGSPGEYPVIVGAHALAQRAIVGLDPRGAMSTLHDLADEPRHLVRMGIVSALREVLLAKGEETLPELATWTDGYFHAHVVLEALADREVLDRLRGPEEVIARLDEAFALADVSPRAAERSQGLRTLREAMPTEVAVFAARFPEVVAWVEAKTASKRPETREVVSQAITALRRGGLKNAEAARIAGLLEASKKPARDAARIVQGTRKRSKGRR